MLRSPNGRSDEPEPRAHQTPIRCVPNATNSLALTSAMNAGSANIHRGAAKIADRTLITLGCLRNPG
jgi:hypothetical protein